MEVPRGMRGAHRSAGDSGLGEKCPEVRRRLWREHPSSVGGSLLPVLREARPHCSPPAPL